MEWSDQSRKKCLAAGVLLLVFAAIKIAIWYVRYDVENVDSPIRNIACDVVAGCRLPDGSLLMFTQLIHNKPFDIVLHTQARQATLTFAMTDMDMGFNRYDLQPQPQPQPQPQGLAARGVRLPYCTVGRNDFIAELVLDEERYRIPFTVSEF